MKEYGQSGTHRIHAPDKAEDRSAKPPRDFIVASFNVRTLADTITNNTYTTHKLHQIIVGCEKHNIDIVAIQEHRLKITNGENINYLQTNLNGWTLAHTNSTHDSHGVAILYSRRLASHLASVEFKSKRIIAAHLRGNPKMCIISAYAPTESSTDNCEKETFYSDLEGLTHSVPPHTVTIVAGDFNARIGKDSHESTPRIVGPNCYHDETNLNGARLINLCKATNLRPSHSHFEHPKYRLCTYHPPNKDHAPTQIDHIMINTKWWKSITNCRSYNTVDIGSDHKIVSANFRLSLRKTKRPPNGRCKFKSESLLDPKVSKEFNIDLQNRFGPLLDEMTALTTDKVQAHADALDAALIQSSTKILGKKKRYNQPSWVSSTTIDLMDKQAEAKLHYKQSPNAANKKSWKTLQKQVSNSFERDQASFLEVQLADLELAAKKYEYGTVWKIIGYISQKPERPIQVRKLDGTLPKNDNEILEEWRTYFSTLLNNKNTNANLANHPLPAQADLKIESTTITRIEVEIAITGLKRNKSPGPDYAMTAEVLKDGGEFVVDQLHHICKLVYDECHAPTQWTSSLIIPLRKKGNLEMMTNYRGISLMSIAAKVYNRVLLNRIRDPVDKILSKNQAGFRKGRSCIQQIHILRRIIEGAYSESIPLFITFVDFKKAFDSIDREMMFSILRHYGIPEKIVSAIRVLYDNSKSRVYVNGQLSDPFDITTGVLQGDVLAPFLFIIVIDYVSKLSAGQFGYITHKGSTSNDSSDRVMRISTRRIERRINDVIFADDIASLENTNARAQEQLNCLSKYSAIVGLKISTEKTVQMRNNLPQNQDPPPNLVIDGHTIEIVEEFKYLGSYINSIEKDVNIRIALAWTAFDKLKSILRHRTSKLSVELKMRIFQAACVSILLYGCESWVLTQQLGEKLDIFARTCYRIMMGIRQSEARMTNEQLYKLAGQRPITWSIRKRQLNFIGHVIRLDDPDKPPTEPANIYALYKSNFKKSSGRPGTSRKSYTDQISEHISGDRCIKYNEAEIRAFAGDKKNWIRVVVAPNKPAR